MLRAEVSAGASVWTRRPVRDGFEYRSLRFALRVRVRDYVCLKHWRSCKGLFGETTTTPTCLGIGEWVRSNPLRVRFVLVRRPKQGRQAFES